MMRILAATFILASSVTAIPYEDCGISANAYQINEVTVGSCSSPPCDLVIGTTVIVNISFDATYSSSIQQQVYLLVNNVKETVTSVVPNICSVITCPVQTARNPQVSSYQVALRNTLPALRGELRWEFLDETGSNLLGCFQVSIRLVYSSLVETKSSLLEPEPLEVVHALPSKLTKVLSVNKTRHSS